jgi:PHS family inorganic phosphate transporter-like MFS transporter
MGMMFGQISFGLLGDTLGRHRVYGRELIVTTVGTLLCILLPWNGISQSGVIAWMSKNSPFS